MIDYSRGLVVAKPSWLRDCLVALLMTMPQMADLDTADDTSSALQALEESSPGMVVLVSEVPGDGVQPLLRQIKTGWPLVPCLVVAETATLQSNARTAGADAALLKAVPIVEFLATAERILVSAEPGMSS